MVSDSEWNAERIKAGISDQALDRSRVFLLDWFEEWENTHDYANPTDLETSIYNANWVAELVNNECRWFGTAFAWALGQLVDEHKIIASKQPNGTWRYRLAE